MAFRDLPLGIHLRAAVTLRHPQTSVTCVPMIAEGFKGVGASPATWVPDRCGKNIVINGTEVRSTNTSWDHCTVVAGPACTIPHTKGRGTFTWAFKVLKGHQITVGIVTPEFDASTHGYINKTKHGWGYYQGDGKVGHGGPASKPYSINYKVTDGKPVLVEGERI